MSAESRIGACPDDKPPYDLRSAFRTQYHEGLGLGIGQDIEFERAYALKA